MTLILASKFKNGVAFAYDRLVYEGKRRIPSRLEDKVFIIGNLAVGISGSFIEQGNSVICVAKNNSVLLNNINPKKLMYDLAKTRTIYRLRKGGFNWIENYKESYIFGFMDNGKPKLFFYDDTRIIYPREREFVGTGFGMYPDVVSHMEKNFNPNRTLTEAIDFLNDGMQIAFRINRTNGDKYLLSGLGFTIVTNKEIKRYQKL